MSRCIALKRTKACRYHHAAMTNVSFKSRAQPHGFRPPASGRPTRASSGLAFGLRPRQPLTPTVHKSILWAAFFLFSLKDGDSNPTEAMSTCAVIIQVNAALCDNIARPVREARFNQSREWNSCTRIVLIRSGVLDLRSTLIILANSLSMIVEATMKEKKESMHLAMRAS